MRTVDERNSSTEGGIKAAKEALRNELRVAMPGIVKGWDAGTQTVTVQLAIREKIINAGAEEEVQIPLLVDVPIVMPRAGGYSLVFAPKPGDECLVVFADSCIDGWYQSGGVQSQVDNRRHDLSDGFAILGCWSQVNKPKIPSSGARLQNDDGTAGISINGNVVNIFGSVRINGSSYASHKHSGVESGSSNTGGVT